MILTDARAGLARSGATRSGYPVLQGFKVPLYAISNIARSGATRSNYTGSRVFIDVGGVPMSCAIVRDGASITDTLDETPTTGSLTTYNYHPTEGQEVVIRLGSSNNSRRLFAGSILSITRRYEGKPANGFDDCQLIDYTWQLGKYSVRTRYLSSTVAAIVADLVGTYAPGYTWQVEADIGAESVDEITFTETSLPGCLSQLTRRVGGSWQCDYQRVVQVFFENTLATNPRPINAVHPTLMEFQSTRDLSQILTRCRVEGGGVNAFANCAIGETILPLDGDPGWYGSSGTVVSGPQRITYTGVSTSTGGGMVGPGAAPSGAPTLNLASGAGIESGDHKYAVTFTTASGESIAGPTAAITVGAQPAPSTAPTPGPATPGTGPEAGAHLYAVTYVTSSGETTPGPTVSASTGLQDIPDTSPVVTAGAAGAGPEAGSHEYAVTFQGGGGETTPGPISAPVYTAPMAAPSYGPYGAPAPGTGLGAGVYRYAYSFVTAVGETTPSPTGSVTTGDQPAPANAPTCRPDTGYYSLIFATGDTVRAAISYSYDVNATVGAGPLAMGPSVTVPVSWDGSHGSEVWVDYYVPSASPMQQYAHLWISHNGAPFRREVVLSFGTGQSRMIQTFQSGIVYPGSSSAAMRRVNVTGIGTGPAGTTERRLYRTTVNGSALHWMAQFTDNTTTSYLDTYTDAAITSNPPPPSVNTATVSSPMLLSAIPTGPTGTTGRKVYRRSAGAGLKYVATLANNSTTTYTDTTPNASLGAAPPAVNTATKNVIPLTAIALGPSLVTARKVYRSAANASTLKLLTTLADNTTTAFTDTIGDASLGATAPATNTAAANRVTLTAIPIGAAAVTARKLYRTASGGSQLKYLATLGDNTTSTYTDAASLATLGANVPIADTSGLQQPQGNVLAGSTSIQVANIGPFPAAGWAVIGNGQQVIRYSSVSGNVLAGIPATGPGAIIASISYNSTITAAPTLFGIPASGAGSVKVPILRGDEVNILITVDDVPAQAALAAMIGGDGVQELYVQDRRLSIREATARGRAQLELRRDVHVEIRFRTQDINTRAGSTVSVNLGAPFFLVGDFVIQQVSIAFLPTEIATPVFTASASSYRLTFEDLLRAIKAKE